MTTTLFTRTRSPYLVSSSFDLLSPSSINDAFALPELYWCKPLSPSAMHTCLSNSFCLGLYIETTPSAGAAALATPPNLEQIGLARLITDYTTFAYLTDVYVLPKEQGKGLGTWLIACVDEILASMGDLRRAVLITSPRMEVLYERKLAMKRVEQEEGGLIIMHRRGTGSVA